MRRLTLLILLTVLLLPALEAAANGGRVSSQPTGDLTAEIEHRTNTGSPGSGGGVGGFRSVQTHTVTKTTRVYTIIEQGRKTPRTATLTTARPSPPKPPTLYNCDTAHVVPPQANLTGGVNVLACKGGGTIRNARFCYGFCNPPRPTKRGPTRAAAVRTRTVTVTNTNAETGTSLVPIPVETPDVDAMVRDVLKRLPKPEPVTSPPLGKPDASGVVGVPFFYAVPPQQWEVIAPTVTANGATITIKATPTELIFDPADGADPQSCFTSGARVTSINWARNHPNAVCMYTYQHSAPLGNSYAASLSIRWFLEVETSGLTTDQINGRVDDYINTTTDIAVPITEIQAVLR